MWQTYFDTWMSPCLSPRYHASHYRNKYFLLLFLTLTRPHPLYHARTPCITPAPPQHANRPQGDTYDDTILARVVNKNPKTWMTELCRLGSSVGRALVRITRDLWFESWLRSIHFCHIGDPRRDWIITH